jgi:hypothetical protein
VKSDPEDILLCVCVVRFGEWIEKAKGSQKIFGGKWVVYCPFIPSARTHEKQKKILYLGERAHFCCFVAVVVAVVLLLRFALCLLCCVQ